MKVKLIYKKDLFTSMSKKDIKDINGYDIREQELYFESYLLIYCDEDKYKILKDKWGKYNGETLNKNELKQYLESAKPFYNSINSYKKIMIELFGV